ncbi:MAG: response regulator [Candidatus Latescibacteria bacterium]|nr:response regulator [Candidatus Latescibacterota bacterium]
MFEETVDLHDAKVLLVDDQPVNLKVLRQALEPAGYQILAATDGERALAIAQRARPDLILLDVSMPGIDGFETCSRLKEGPATAAIPVLFITARTETEDVVKGFGVGGADYIAKPFRSEEVLARVAAHVRLKRLTAQVRAQNSALTSANEEIKQADQRKSDYLARMSHDLRTPMNAIIGYTRILIRRSKDSLEPRQFRNLQNIRQCADHLLALLNDILDLAKIEAGRMDLNIAEVDLGELSQGCLTAVGPLAQEGVKLQSELVNGASVHTDEDRLRRVLMNLLGNAVKYTEEGSITVALTAAEAGVELSVADTGAGIPAADLPHIFDEFRQVEGQHGDKPEGSGLGLAIARKSVELLAGTIGVESQEGKGTRFWVRLPQNHVGAGNHV